MSNNFNNSIYLFNTNKISLLSGLIELNNEITLPIPVYVVIVDDNSGSMSGQRANYCIEKTKTIIRQCMLKGVKYQYAT